MELDALAARYIEVTEEREAELLKRLNDGGWEPGCWIRPEPEMIVRATQQEVTAFLEAIRTRKRPPRDIYDDCFPDGLPCEPIDGGEPCYVVLSQRCDIVSAFRNEPLIELAQATVCSDKVRIGNAWRNSTREFPIDPRACPTHLVELRYRYFIGKLDLVELPLHQALPRDDAEYNVRERFPLRVGQRYTRSAVPDELAVKVVEPLQDLVKGDAELTGLFYEWALYHGGNHEQPPGVMAVYRLDIDEALDPVEQSQQEAEIRQRAEDRFEAVIEALPGEAKALLDLDDDHRTHAVPETEHVVTHWRQSWKLEWDEESFGGDADAAIPAR